MKGSRKYKKINDPIGYNISEDDFKKMSIESMLKYIIHNNQNNEEFNECFYNSKKLPEKPMRSFGSRRRSRIKIKKR